MSDLQQFLYPVNSDHSVKEAVITVFFKDPVPHPERFKELLEGNLKKYFDSFERTNQIQLKFQGAEVDAGNPVPKPQVKPDVGFRFNKIENKKLAKVLQVRNEETRNILSYHTLAYRDWDLFFPEFLDVVKEIAKFETGMKVQAFSLHYIDEFEWLKEGGIDYNLIFNKNSELLPAYLFESQLNNYNLTTVNPEPVYYNRLDIANSVGKKNILSISHNIIRELPEIQELEDLLDDASFKNVLNEAHEKNKSVLFSLLKEEVCQLINLSK